MANWKRKHSVTTRVRFRMVWVILFAVCGAMVGGFIGHLLWRFPVGVFALLAPQLGALGGLLVSWEIGVRVTLDTNCDQEWRRKCGASLVGGRPRGDSVYRGLGGFSTRGNLSGPGRNAHHVLRNPLDPHTMGCRGTDIVRRRIACVTPCDTPSSVRQANGVAFPALVLVGTSLPAV